MHNAWRLLRFYFCKNNGMKRTHSLYINQSVERMGSQSILTEQVHALSHFQLFIVRLWLEGNNSQTTCCQNITQIYLTLQKAKSQYPYIQFKCNLAIQSRFNDRSAHFWRGFFEAKIFFSYFTLFITPSERCIKTTKKKLKSFFLLLKHPYIHLKNKIYDRNICAFHIALYYWYSLYLSKTFSICWFSINSCTETP